MSAPVSRLCRYPMTHARAAARWALGHALNLGPLPGGGNDRGKVGPPWKRTIWRLALHGERVPCVTSAVASIGGAQLYER